MPSSTVFSPTVSIESGALTGVTAVVTLSAPFCSFFKGREGVFIRTLDGLFTSDAYFGQTAPPDLYTPLVRAILTVLISDL